MLNTQNTISVRPASKEDAKTMLLFMRDLAEFEGYLKDFRVTESALLSRGFPETGAPEFYALLVETKDNRKDTALGMLVYYFIPFTFDLRPTLFIKELFVSPAARNLGAGEALFKAAVQIAQEQNCGRIKWDVLHDNEAAQRFYKRQGAFQDSTWLGFIYNGPGHDPST